MANWYDYLGYAFLGPNYGAAKSVVDTFGELGKFGNKLKDVSSAVSNWNDSSIDRQEAFNSAEAEKQRSWEEQMSNTAVQRQVADIKAAGLNPWLALNGGSVSGAATPAGSSASSNSAFASNYMYSSMTGNILRAITSVCNSAMNVVGNVAKAAAAG